jgi:hypothetical protein
MLQIFAVLITKAKKVKSPPNQKVAKYTQFYLKSGKTEANCYRYVYCRKCDLSSLKSVREFAEEFNKTQVTESLKVTKTDKTIYCDKKRFKRSKVQFLADTKRSLMALILTIFYKRKY